MTVMPIPDEYLPYTSPCVACARPTWWRTADTGKPICLHCSIANRRDAVNGVPLEVRQAFLLRGADPTRKAQNGRLPN
jgi:hypothetical protein